MSDILPVPKIGVQDLRNNSQGIEGAYISVAKIQPAYDSCNY
jgi:hypothetical protein